MSAFDPKRTLASLAMLSPKSTAKPGPTMSASKPWGSGGYEGGKYEKQRQPGEHDNLLNAAGIEFA